MLATYLQIAAIREACNAYAYPSDPPASRPTHPNVRFAAAAVAAYSAAADIFVSGTFTRCNAAAVASSAAASADLGGDMLFAYAGICTTRTACIAAGNPPAPALPANHTGESLVPYKPILVLHIPTLLIVISEGCPNNKN
jgi:hypothetical protein